MKSKKQEHMLEIMEIVTTNVAGDEEYTIRDMVKMKSHYPELQLIHNMARLLMDPEFSVEDVYWMHSQVGFYVKEGKKSAHYDTVCNHIRQIIDMVPETLQDDLRKFKVPLQSL